MFDEDDLLLAGAAVVIMVDKIKTKKRRHWMRPSLASRKKYSASDMLSDFQKDDFDAIRGEIRGTFNNFLRMSSADFEFLLQMIAPKISKMDTNYREAIPTQERLAVTLRFFASGDSFISLSYLFKISKQSISKIVSEVCEALIHALKEYMKMPTTTEEWLSIAAGYFIMWNVPNCFGAMDGKHIVLQAPIGSGTEFFNYKSFFSIVLLAVVDANYNIIWANVGCQGRISDGGVFSNSNFGKSLLENGLHLPVERPLPGRNTPVPFILLADDAFPLSNHVMKPYPGLHEKGSKERICNYRFSRGRRVSENTFGIIASVFRVFRKPMLLEPEKATKVTTACLHLHNYLRKSDTSRNLYNPVGTYDSEDTDTGELIPGSWRADQRDIQSLFPLTRIARKSPSHAQEIRNEFREFFVSENGQVPWQNKCA